MSSHITDNLRNLRQKILAEGSRHFDVRFIEDDATPLRNIHCDDWPAVVEAFNVARECGVSIVQVWEVAELSGCSVCADYTEWLLLSEPVCLQSNKTVSAPMSEANQ